MLEETGYICDSLEYIDWFYTWPGRASQKNFVFVARGLKREENKNKEKQVKLQQNQNQSEHFEYIGHIQRTNNARIKERNYSKCYDNFCTALWIFRM